MTSALLGRQGSQIAFEQKLQDKASSLLLRLLSIRDPSPLSSVVSRSQTFAQKARRHEQHQYISRCSYNYWQALLSVINITNIPEKKTIESVHPNVQFQVPLVLTEVLFLIKASQHFSLQSVKVHQWGLLWLHS